MSTTTTPPTIRRVRRVPSPLGWVLLGVVAAVWTLPISGMVLTAMRAPEVAGTRGWWTVVTEPALSLENLREVLAGSGAVPPLWDGLVASLAITLPATVLLVVVAAPLAYLVAWGNHPGRRWLFLGAVALLFVPLQVTLVPLVAAYDATGLRGSWPGLWLAHVAFGLPIAVVLLAGAMRSVPSELIETARSDGAGHGATLWRVVVPLVVPALAGVAALQFLVVWNDLLVAAALLGGPDPGSAPLPLALAELVRTRPQELHLLGAGGLVTILVPLAVFAGLARLLVSATAAATIRE